MKQNDGEFTFFEARQRMLNGKKVYQIREEYALTYPQHVLDAAKDGQRIVYEADNGMVMMAGVADGLLEWCEVEDAKLEPLPDCGP